jgi:hypothetical protein
MRGKFNTTPPPPTPLTVFSAEENIQPTPIGRQPSVATDEGFSYHVTRAYNHPISPDCFLVLDNEPISGSHFSSF